MKRISLLLMSGLVAASFAVPVCAKDFTDYGAPDMGHNQDKMEKMKSKMMGRHKMTGTVDSIDHEKGMLTLKSSAPDMMLHFPPDALKDMKNGDTITIEMGFSMGERGKKMY